MPNALLIPNDLAACQALLAEMAKTMAVQDQKITTLQERVGDQERIIAELLQRAFQKRSERYLEDPNQLTLDFGEAAGNAAEGLADAIDEVKRITVPEHLRRTRVPKKPRNEQLPAHLERRDVEAAVPDEMRFCPTHGGRKIIGYDYVETLMFEQPKLWVRRLAIPKFACPDSPACGVAQPSRPPGLVEGNRYDTSIAAQIVTMKFGYHLPIYRHQDIFAGSGWTPQRSTLLNIAEAAGDLLAPFIAHLRNVVLGSGVIGTDDTRVTLLLPKFLPDVIAGDAKSKRIHDVFQAARNEKRPSVSGRMWAYRSVTVKLNVFDFTVSRHRDGPDEFLVDSGFTGTMLADCYSGYQGISLRSDERIVRAACHAHARRKVFDARENHPLLATQLLAAYQQLYDVEDRARAMTFEERLSLRQLESRPIWERIQELIQGEAAAGVLPKEKIHEALTYLRNQSGALEMFLSDGRIPIDNNDVEQLMKQVAIGRKNWLFIGSVAAGERAANFLTLVSSAVRNDLDASCYLKAVFDALLAGSLDYESLRPDQWAAAHPEAIRVYRQEERRERLAAKTARREDRRPTNVDDSDAATASSDLDANL
jgi:transposase